MEARKQYILRKKKKKGSVLQNERMNKEAVQVLFLGRDEQQEREAGRDMFY